MVEHCKRIYDTETILLRASTHLLERLCADLVEDPQAAELIGVIKIELGIRYPLFLTNDELLKKKEVGEDDED